MKVARWAVELAAAALLTIGLGTLGVPTGPDLFLLAVADAARTGSAAAALLTGLAAGLLEDALVVPDRLLGLHGFSKVLVGYLLSVVGSRTIVDTPPVAGALLGGAVLVEAGLVGTLLHLFRGDPVLPAADLVFARAVLTAALGAAVAAAVRVPWSHRLRDWRRRRLS